MSSSETANKAWHAESAAAALAALDTTSHGLSSVEAQGRLGRHGPNALPEGGRRSPLRMLVDQFADFMILVLIAAAVVSGIVVEPSDTIAIVVIVLLNAVVGLAQERRAERAMAALRLIEAAQLRCAEAALTGESQPVEKHTEVLPDPRLPLGDRASMAWKGTLVANGLLTIGEVGMVSYRG